MPSFFHHDRSDYLFPKSSRTPRKPLLPVSRLTRADIETQLKKSLNTKRKINQIYSEHRDQQLKPVPTLQLFSEPTESAPHGTASNPGSLSLRQIPHYSLFQEVETRSYDVLTMQVDQYTKQRQYGIQPLSIEIPPPMSTQNILKEVLNDPSLWSSSTTLATPQDTPQTIPPPTQASPARASPARAAPPPLALGPIPEQHLPIIATPLQKQLCDRITQHTTAFDKISFERMIGLLNHPVVAMADEYEQVDAWNGSGKTKFIKELVEHLQKEHMGIRIAIATCDNDTESFLYDKIKTQLNLPCVRLNSVLDDAWEREYGVVFETQYSGASMRGSKAEADVIIAFDIRLRPNNPIFFKIANKQGTATTPEIIWLFTVGSIEHRAVTYFDTHSNEDTWAQNWWSDSTDYRKLVHQQNAWVQEEQVVADQAMTSVLAWMKSGCSDHYLFSRRESTPAAQEPVIQSPITPPNREGSPSDMDIDSESGEVSESVKAQVRQFFRYPSLRPSFDRSTDQSRQNSPRIRSRSRNTRWRESNAECDDDEDDVASFYSANEYVQDIKPIPISDAEAIDDAISCKLHSLKPAFEKEYQAIISRLQAQYNDEMKELRATYEKQAYEKLRDV